ncbi:MAG: amidophosphoribosyltransferase [Eubacteriales bacterium]|nr:amidophosphoribosyltransferase [Eubacteriales bacterium]MDY3333233.1 amidophosphoribosyltransferase [Gallibacter sp.]
MGGFFGVASKRDCLSDVFFGTDYHSHLGTKRGGIAAYDEGKGLQREIHKIENSPFRTKFERIYETMHGRSAIGCISDSDPQPLLIYSKLGNYAISTIGVINNKEEIVQKYLFAKSCHVNAMSGSQINSTEIVAFLINQKDSIEDGIRFAQEIIDGTASVLILKDNGDIIAGRDLLGRIPITICEGEDGNCVTFETFAAEKLEYTPVRNLGPGEIVKVTADDITTIKEPEKKCRICAFLWTYYGYPTSDYEDINVEIMRYNNGRIMARDEKKPEIFDTIDYIGGMPDSGTPHAIGYSNGCQKPFSRPFIKYTPTWQKSFTVAKQEDRNKVARMKQVAIPGLIRDKKMLLVDDSIVRGTQLRETVKFLYKSGAKEVHMRSACPPIMYSCKYLNFTRTTNEMELVSRRIIMELEGEEGLKHIDEYSDGNTQRGKQLRDLIAKKLGFDSLDFQTLDGMIEAIGLDKEDVCTYCWNGKE